MFRRKGKGGEGGGDFESLKELVTDFAEQTPFGPSQTVRKVLIRAYQYLIAKFDVDGFRIETLKFVEPDFARTFGNAMREFALEIGKKNFFTFGEVFDDECKIAQFIGRDAGATEEPIGVDATLDFPLFFRLPGVVKGFAAPSDLVGMYQERKRVQRNLKCAVIPIGPLRRHFLQRVLMVKTSEDRLCPNAVVIRNLVTARRRRGKRGKWYWNVWPKALLRTSVGSLGHSISYAPASGALPLKEPGSHETRPG